MEYKTTSIIVGRMKRKDKEEIDYPCFITLFDINDPHKTAEVPKKRLDFDHVEKVVIRTPKVLNYLLAGNDLVVNDLVSINVEYNKERKNLYIDCTTKK